jgi:hypothetical protein
MSRAHRERKMAGQVVSELLRHALTTPSSQALAAAQEPSAIYGFKPFASRGGLVTNELIDQLRNEDAY